MIAVGLAMTVQPGAWAGDLHLDLLKTQTGCYTNVTVCDQSPTDIFIRHEQGITNIKLENLDAQTIARLNAGGFAGGASASANPAASAEESERSPRAAAASISASASKPGAQLRPLMMFNQTALKALSALPVNPKVVGLILGALLAVYLFFCYSLKLICQKTGNEPGILIWLPIFQMLPLLRAAGMSGWWLLGLFVPVVNLIAQIVWCFKIVQARGKSVWAAIGLLLPVTNLVALLYLAFSSAEDLAPPGNRKFAVAGAPLPAEA